MARLSVAYRPRRPQQTVLYQVLARHLGAFIERVEAADRPLPDFVRRELEGFVNCGKLELGFARQACRSCTFQRLVGFSCGGRGFCPSCLGRRMIAGAAALVDELLPPAPLRQWVLSLPVPLRFVLLYRADWCSEVLRVFWAEVSRWQRWTAKRELGLSSVDQAHGAAVTAIHRVGSYGNANLHFHSAVLDGVYVSGAAGGGAPVFQALPAPGPEDLLEVSCRVYARTRELLRAAGYDWEQPQECDAPQPLGGPMTQQELLLDCARASLRDVALLGPTAGQPLLPRGGPELHVPADLDHRRAARLAAGGFDLQANRRVSRLDHAGRERMMRYLLHPPLSHDRLSWTDDATGRVRLRFSRPWRNGTDAIVMDPLTFIGRLVPMVPLPGSHQLRYFGVLAPRAALRPQVVPPRVRPRQLVMFDRKGTPTPAARGCAQSAIPKLQRMSWARLLHRMGGWEMEDCPRCGSAMATVRLVTAPDEVRRTLETWGGVTVLPPPRPQAPPRGPPGQLSLAFA